MISYDEYIAFLEDAEKIRGELDALAPKRQLQRLKEILQQSHRPYRLVMERIVLDSLYYQNKSLARAVETVKGLRDREREKLEPPKNFFDLLASLFRERQWAWGISLGLGVAVALFWSSLPDAMKMWILERVFGRDFSWP